MSDTLTLPAAPTTWLTPIQAARYLGIAHQTLANWRLTNRGPKFARRGRVVRYRRVDLDSWMLGGKAR